MSTDSSKRSPLIRFLDGFFQDRNIKWMLGIGMLILFGSSLMLVVSEWQHYTPIWKYLILLGYTAAIYFGGELSYWRLGLHRTGTVLQALTVLLLPITFLALHGVQRDHWFSLASLARHSVMLGLFVANFLFASAVARRIFHHFLRGSQPTFVASYLVLCMAGAIAPGLPATWSPWIALVFWAVFIAGVIKVNRHVFWLTEEHRLPRIFGFFPIALLGTQFLTLFAINFAAHIEWQWMGLACVLVSIPVLLTADSVTHVYQQRTGDLIRPWPWSIVLPVLVGLGLCAAGVCLAATDFPRPHALVPTTILVAVLMTVISRRTQNSAFVGTMLVSVLLAYNFSPVFFIELARSIVGHAAATVREQRLPFAFYGLTYLPLLIALLGFHSYAVKVGSALFARPIRLFSLGLSCLLFGLALGHAKAVFPVSDVMILVFGAQAVLFRDRRPMILAVLASIAAAYGVTSFVEGILELQVPRDMRFLSLAVMAGLLLGPGRLIDKWTMSLPSLGERTPVGKTRSTLDGSLCQFASLLLTFVIAAAWILKCGFAWAEPVNWLPGILLTCLFFVQAVVWLKPGLGQASILFAASNGLLWMAKQGMEASTIISIATASLLALWVIAGILRIRSDSRLSKAFAQPAYHVSLAGLLLLLLGYWLPMFVMTTLGIGTSVSLLCGMLTVLWAFDAARRTHFKFLSGLGCLGVLGLVGSVLAIVMGPEQSWEWIPCAWAITALVAVPFSIISQRWLQDQQQRLLSEETDKSKFAALQAVAIPVGWMVFTILSLTAVISLVMLTTPFRIAGLVALVGLLWLGIWDRQQTIRDLAVILVNWQVVSLLISIFAPSAATLLDLTPQQFAQCALPLAALSAASLLGFQLICRRDDVSQRDHIAAHIFLLRSLTVFAIGTSFLLLPVGLNLSQVGVAMLTFVLLAGSELWSACRTQRPARVWVAEAVIAAAVGYFLLFGVISFGRGLSMYVVLAAGIISWVLGRLSAHNPRTAVLSEPLRQTGMALPLVAVVIGMVRHMGSSQPGWLGLNSLALLLAAGFYFWRGVESTRKSLVVLSAVILNIALVMLWRELQWWDPQFFMIPLGLSILGIVEFLKAEIPARFHDPLRYLGALTILVSPTFHIVGGSWIHIFTLLVASVIVTLLSIGLRIRVLMYTGTAFLIADLLAMIVRGSIDNPNILWIAGIALGAAVIVLAAVCENHREKLLARVRFLAADLESWE